MIEKRSFMLGFIIGKLSMEPNMPGSWWESTLISHCKKMNMTIPTNGENKELADFLEYVSTVTSK